MNTECLICGCELSDDTRLDEEGVALCVDCVENPFSGLTGLLNERQIKQDLLAACEKGMKNLSGPAFLRDVADELRCLALPGWGFYYDALIAKADAEEAALRAAQKEEA